MTRDEFALYARRLIDDAGDAFSNEPWQGYIEVSTDGVDVAINALASAYASVAAERDALRAEVLRLQPPTREEVDDALREMDHMCSYGTVEQHDAAREKVIALARCGPTHG